MKSRIRITPVKLVVGLGNPGAAYAHTPHNVGFDVVTRLAGTLGGDLRGSLRYKAHTAKVRVDDTPLWLVMPDTFMNLSGEAVAAVLRRTGGAPEDTLVVSDDADLPLGRLRLRQDGRSGGHRGLESIIACLGTTAFPRLRIGVGRGAGARDLVGHVLSRPPPEARELLAKTVAVAAEAVLVWLRQGVDTAMNRYNGMDLGAAGAKRTIQDKKETDD